MDLGIEQYIGELQFLLDNSDNDFLVEFGSYEFLVNPAILLHITSIGTSSRQW